MGYAQHIKIDAFVMTRDQLAGVTDIHGPQEVYQKINRELAHKRHYLVLRLENRGPQRPTGRLRCNINKGASITEVDIWRVDNGDRFKEGNSVAGWYKFINLSGRSHYIIPIGQLDVDEDDNVPEITCKWMDLWAE